MDTVELDFVEVNELLQRRAVPKFFLPLNYLAFNDIAIVVVDSLYAVQAANACPVHLVLECATNEGAAIATAAHHTVWKPVHVAPACHLTRAAFPLAAPG